MARKASRGEGSGSDRAKRSGGSQSGARKRTAPTSAAVGRKPPSAAARAAEAAAAKKTATWKGKPVTPDYARRMQAAAAKGKTGAAARGHKPDEHKERARRAVKAGRMTEAQLARAAKFFQQQLVKAGNPRSEVREIYASDWRDRVAERGWDFVAKCMAIVDARNSQWKALGSPNSEQRRKNPAKYVVRDMRDWDEGLDIEEDEEWMLYYH